MNLLTRSQVARLFRAEGVSDRNARIGSALALCEAPAIRDDGVICSDFDLIGDLDLVNVKWGPSVGGLQIRSVNAQFGTGGIRDAKALKLPEFNVHSAVVIMRADGWDQWSTFTSGKFKAYLPGMYPPPKGVYVVVYGDTISQIPEKFNNQFTWQDLAIVNNLHDPYNIYIGQNLVLPV